MSMFRKIPPEPPKVFAKKKHKKIFPHNYYSKNPKKHTHCFKPSQKTYQREWDVTHQPSTPMEVGVFPRLFGGKLLLTLKKGQELLVFKKVAKEKANAPNPERKKNNCKVILGWSG